MHLYPSWLAVRTATDITARRLANNPFLTPATCITQCRPTVIYSLRDYSKPDMQTGRSAARAEVPFLFKAFEAGQQPPPRPGTKKADQPRAATIHEYLDWTVTASEAEDPDELDFAGFRVIVLSPRAKLLYPPPNTPYNEEVVEPGRGLGAALPPIPRIMVHNKPICAATIRVGPAWLEVPFYATQESRRNKGGDHPLPSPLLCCVQPDACFLQTTILRVFILLSMQAMAGRCWKR